MLYEILTPSGTTLAHETRQTDALRCACLLSVCQHSIILVYCHHFGGRSHLVARLNDGELVPLSA